MTRTLAMLLAVVAVAGGVTGCAARPAGAPSGAVPASPASSAKDPAPTPSYGATMVMMPPGGPNPEAAIPNPGTGGGSPLLVRALLPQFAPGREAVLLLPPAVVALPDRDPRSLFIGLRHESSPVAGSPACAEWTTGLSAAVVSGFNQPGVQLGIQQSTQAPAGRPTFSETIVTGPPPVLSALADPPLPAACRRITTGRFPGGVKPGTVTAPDASGERTFEITGTGKVPVWQWAEVVQGRGFLLEIRLSDQSDDPDPGAALPAITADAYRRAVAVLASGHQ